MADGELTNAQFVRRAGVWAAFLIGSLFLALIYLWDPPVPIGFGLARLFGWGGAMGVGIGFATLVYSRQLLLEGTRRGKVLTIIGAAVAGFFGGAGGAALLDASQVVNRYVAEVPVVDIRGDLGRQSARSISIVILEPTNPTWVGFVDVESIRGPIVNEGDCLVAIVEKGWLGGAWTDYFEPQPCSPERGSSASHVIVMNDDFATWRWHNPRTHRTTEADRVVDDALPENLICRVNRSQSWLYSCAVGAGDALYDVNIEVRTK